MFAISSSFWKYGIDIRGNVQIDRMNGNEMSVLGRHQIRFDVISSEFQCQSISRQCMLRNIVRGTPMANDQRWHMGDFRRELGLEWALVVLPVGRQCRR